jgi:protein-disulfide isomerase
MQKASRTSLLFLPLVLAGGLATLACVEAPPKVGTTGADGKADEGATTATTAVPGGAESCTTLATKLCERAGEESATCASVKKTTSLFSANTCDVALADIEHSFTQLAAAGKACADLADRLCKDIGPDTQTCEMVKTETPKMPAEQCEGMVAQYDEVLAQLQRMEAKNKPLPEDKVAKMTEGEVPSYGPADAKVTVVEFSDFECPYCSLAATAVTELKTQYGDRVRFVFRQFPLSFHPAAHLAAQASLAANAQGKFWEFHDKLFANQKALGRAELEKYAEELGLDMDAFKKALDEGTYKATVDAELALGGDVFVDGTPTIFVNGTRVANATDTKSITDAIEKALAG